MQVGAWNSELTGGSWRKKKKCPKSKKIPQKITTCFFFYCRVQTFFYYPKFLWKNISPKVIKFSSKKNKSWKNPKKIFKIKIHIAQKKNNNFIIAEKPWIKIWYIYIPVYMYQLSMMTCHCKLTKQNDNMIFFQYKHMRNIKYTVKNTTRYTLKITYHNFKYLNHNYTVPCTFGLVTTREQLTPNLPTKTHFFRFEFFWRWRFAPTLSF